jgi:signal transduction histidine kinase/PAS domain-containing protein
MGHHAGPVRALQVTVRSLRAGLASVHFCDALQRSDACYIWLVVGIAAKTAAVWDAERLNLLLAASGLGDWSWDAKSDVMTFSERAAEIFGFEPGQCMTQCMTWTALVELLHPGLREQAQAAFARAIEHHTDYTFDFRLLVGAGERWVTVRGRGQYDEHGRALGMLGVVQEVTRDRLLLRVDDAVRPLVAPDDITYTAARVLGEHLRVHRCAYAFVEPDEDTFTLTGNYTHGVHSIVGRYRFRQFGAECLRLMREGEPYVVSDSLSDPRIDEEDRKAYLLTAIRAVICVPIRKSGQFVAAMAVHMQTPRRWTQPEVELVQQVASRCWESIERARVEREREGLLQAAEAANRAKDEFLAMLGHELRNPLAPMVTALHLMKLRGEESCARERTIVERQVSHLARLVDDLLDVSRIARGKVELKYETVELSEIVARAIEVASPLLEERAHELRIEIARTGLPVYGDAARLVQVVSNLLTNAAKYTPPNGRIEVTGESDQGEVVLRVRDNGVGMSQEIRKHAFDLFVQGQQTIERARGGLGLGLTIVKSLVERHRGTVTANSEGAGRGSEFVVRLPRVQRDDATAAEPAQAHPLAPDTTVTGTRILVVDDNRDAAEMLQSALEIYGCQVEVAHDGPQALKLAATHVFDAALLDIGLPVMDGYELAGRLKRQPNLEHARLVAVTGYGQDSDRRRALAAGFEEHLVKPVDMGKLQKIVSSLRAQSA